MIYQKRYLRQLSQTSFNYAYTFTVWATTYVKFCLPVSTQFNDFAPWITLLHVSKEESHFIWPQRIVYLLLKASSVRFFCLNQDIWLFNTIWIDQLGFLYSQRSPCRQKDDILLGVWIWNRQSNAAKVWFTWYAINIYVRITDLTSDNLNDALYWLQGNCNWLFFKDVLCPKYILRLIQLKARFFEDYSQSTVLFWKNSPNIFLWISWGLERQKWDGEEWLTQG